MIRTSAIRKLHISVPKPILQQYNCSLTLDVGIILLIIIPMLTAKIVIYLKNEIVHFMLMLMLCSYYFRRKKN